MAAAEQATIAAPAFSVVRRGYDPDQVARHLNRVDAEFTILAADRAAAVEQATQLSQQLSTCRSELDAARSEIERLRSELQVLAGPPDNIDSMNNRLQVMLRLAKDEFTGMRADAAAHAAAHAADIIAAVGGEADDLTGFGFDESELRTPQDVAEIEQLRRQAAEERLRLDEEAAAKRAADDEEFRKVLALRCREAMAQIGKLQVEAMRTARRVLDDAEEQARVVVADAREAVRRTVDEAQREVDDLQELRLRLAAQLDTSRELLNRAMPEARAAVAAVLNGSVPPSAAAAMAAVAPQAAPAAGPATDPATATSPPAPAVPIATGPTATDPAASAPTWPAPPEAVQPVPALHGSMQHEPIQHESVQHESVQPAPVQSAPVQQAPATQPEPQPAAAGPALATLAVPPGWPVAPGSVPAEATAWAPRSAAAHEQTQPGLPEMRRDDADGSDVGGDGRRAQPVRIPPRDPDVPGPSRVPYEEQDPQVAPPRRYP